MSKSVPFLVASISVYCTVGCGGSSTTSVTTDTSAGAAAGPATTPAPTPPATAEEPAPVTTQVAGELAWRGEASGRTEPLSAVWGSGANDVWAVGGHVILHSRGDGAWTTVHEDAAEEYSTVYGAGGWIYVAGFVCDAGLCQGGVVLRSSDGGATWTRSTLGAGVTGMAGGSMGDVVYANSGDLYVSHDHFATTEKQALPWSAAEGIFVDGSAVYVFGGQRGAQIRRSSDGGATWTMVYSGFSGSQSGYANGIARGRAAMFATVNGCYVPYCIAGLLRSDDGGATWQESSRPQDYIAGAWAASDDEVYIGGTHLMHSVDGGAHFSQLEGASIASVWGSGANDVYAVGNGGTILHGTR
jgi:hypothetical protein